MEKLLFVNRKNEFENDSPRLSFKTITSDPRIIMKQKCFNRLSQIRKLERFIRVLRLPKHFPDFLRDCKAWLQGMSKEHNLQKYIKNSDFTIFKNGDIFLEFQNVSSVSKIGL